MITIPRCPACTGALRPCFETDCGERRMAVSRCERCASYVKSPFFDRAELEAVYGHYAHHERHFQPGPGEIDNLVSKILRIERAGGRRGTLLEIGCGRGYLLTEAARRGWEVQGVEIQGSARENLLPGLEGKVRFIRSENDYAMLPSETCDALCSYQVFEHLLDPAGTLRQWARLLKPGGILVLDTPNAASLAARLHQESWVHHTAPEHFVLFTPRALRQLFRESDLRVTRVIYGGSPPVCSGSPVLASSARRLFRFRSLTRFARTLLQTLGAGDNIEVIGRKAGGMRT